MTKNTAQAKQWLDKCYSDSTLLETMDKRWYADFKCSCTDTNDAECSGCPNSAVVPENTEKLHVLTNHKLKLRDIAKELKISEGSVFTILHEHLFMRKLCSKCVQHLLTVNQKQRLSNSEHYLQMFQDNKKESAEWITAGESCPKWPKMQISAGKALVPVFWDAQGILFIDYLEKGRTTVCLQTSKEDSRERNLAPIKKWYRKLRHIFSPPKKSFYKKGIELLEKCWNQCIMLEGDYID